VFAGGAELNEAMEEAGELETVLLNLRLWALHHLNNLGDSTARPAAVGEPTVEDCEGF
jgi:hypothetical protein